MKRVLLAGLLLSTAAHADAPVLRSVTLSGSGVAEMGFAAEVDGPTTLAFDVPLDQVDDVLASLRVTDPAGGLPLVSLPGQQNLAERFRTLPFSPDALASAEALLAALVGARVHVPQAGIDGAVLSVTPFDVKLPGDGGALTRHRLAIATGTGLETVVLEDVPGVDLTSPELRAQIGTALAAVADQRVQDRRTVSVALTGSGRRSVQLATVVAAPVWKITYRLTLLPGETSARLQGFAVVDNLSGQDWDHVALTLTSGRPVLYHQKLYEALFADRPEAPVDVAARPAPNVDDGVMQGSLARQQSPGQAEFRRSLRNRGPDSEADAAPKEVPMPSPAAAPPSPVPPPPPPALATEQAAQVVFRLTEPVTAANGHALLLPVLDRTVPALRVALVQAGQGDGHPLAAMQITNDTGSGLPPGLVALSAGDPAAFVGNARLPVTPQGEVRLASFAVDQAVRVDTSYTQESRTVGARAARGVLEVLRRERLVTVYRAFGAQDGPRTLVIDHPRRPGYSLAEPAGAAETPTDYRISQPLPANGTATVRAVLERPISQSFTLLEEPGPRLLALAALGEMTPEFRAAMTRAAELRGALDRAQAEAKTLRDQQGAVVSDQGRIRDNLRAVPANSDLQKRYLSQLRQQEDDLAALRTQNDAADGRVRAADAALRDYVASLTL